MWGAGRETCGLDPHFGQRWRIAVDTEQVTQRQFQQARREGALSCDCEDARLAVHPSIRNGRSQVLGMGERVLRRACRQSRVLPDHHGAEARRG